MKSIGIIGGGTAGFVAALILKNTYPSVDIEVVRSTKIGTIGVGEGSTEHWSFFMDYVNIEPYEIIKECDATFKSGIMFENWGEKDYLQNVEGNLVGDQQGLLFVYAKYIAEGYGPKDLVGINTWNSMVPFNRFMDNTPKDTLVSQYHFNTNKLNDFLTKKSIERGISVVDDEILDVVTEQDQIKFLKSENKIYNYDFYVDCTGFSKILISKLGAKWNSYSDYLAMKEAIVFPTDNEDYPMWTLARAMDAGWMFRIPVWERKGNGYIFDSNFINADEAQREVESYLGHSIEVAKHIKFDPGALDKTWIGNCCAIGLSASFVEPLEASSIGTSIQQSFLLADRINNYNEHTIKLYNKQVEKILENIRDFIVLHYITNRDDTDFWKYIKTIDLPESLKDKLNLWKTRLPNKEDFSDITTRLLFNEYNFLIVMHGLGLIDKETARKQYSLIPQDAKEYAHEVQQNMEQLVNVKCIPHQMMIDLIRRLS